MHKVNGIWGQWRGEGGVVDVLDFGAIGGGVSGMRVIMWARRIEVLELVQHFLKVIRHGNVARPR